MKSPHDGWSARRNNRRSDDADARFEGFRNYAHQRFSESIQDLRDELDGKRKSRGRWIETRQDARDLGMSLSTLRFRALGWYPAAVAAAALKIPVRTLRLLVYEKKVRARRLKTKNARKLFFRASDLRPILSADRNLIRSAAVIRSKYRLDELVSKKSAAEILNRSPRAVEYLAARRRLKKIGFNCYRVIAFKRDRVVAIAKKTSGG